MSKLWNSTRQRGLKAKTNGLKRMSTVEFCYDGGSFVESKYDVCDRKKHETQMKKLKLSNFVWSRWGKHSPTLDRWKTIQFVLF
jgi:hypothetical protein